MIAMSKRDFDQVSRDPETEISLITVTFSLEDVLLNKAAGDDFNLLTDPQMQVLMDEICEFYQLEMYQIQTKNGEIQVRIMAEERHMNVFQDAVRHAEA